MVNNGRNNRYYGNRRGPTIPIMSRVSIETYQRLHYLAEHSDLNLNQLNVMFIEYGLSHARLGKYDSYRIKFDQPYGTSDVGIEQEGDSDAQFKTPAIQFD